MKTHELAYLNSEIGGKIWPVYLHSLIRVFSVQSIFLDCQN